jgi:phage recombination protein Bet
MTSTTEERALSTVVGDPQWAEAQRIKSQIAAVRAVLAPELTDQEMLLFAMVAQRLRLDPFVRQIHAIKRDGKLTFQTGIDGFRSSAEETGDYRGITEPEYGPTIDEPFAHPEWARVGVQRADADGSIRVQYHIAWWDEYAPADVKNAFMWRKMPRNQLAKCAEAGAFRKQFPKRFSGLYEPAEMEQERRPELARPVGPTAAERAAERADAVRALAEHVDQPPPPPPDVSSAAATDDSLSAGLSAGDLRERLRARRIAIPFALAEARQKWGADVATLDSLTDAQRGELWLVLTV